MTFLNYTKGDNQAYTGKTVSGRDLFLQFILYFYFAGLSYNFIAFVISFLQTAYILAVQLHTCSSLYQYDWHSFFHSVSQYTQLSRLETPVFKTTEELSDAEKVSWVVGTFILYYLIRFLIWLFSKPPGGGGGGDNASDDSTKPKDGGDGKKRPPSDGGDKPSDEKKDDGDEKQPPSSGYLSNPAVNPTHPPGGPRPFNYGVKEIYFGTEAEETFHRTIMEGRDPRMEDTFRLMDLFQFKRIENGPDLTPWTWKSIQDLVTPANVGVVTATAVRSMTEHAFKNMVEYLKPGFKTVVDRFRLLKQFLDFAMLTAPLTLISMGALLEYFLSGEFAPITYTIKNALFEYFDIVSNSAVRDQFVKDHSAELLAAIDSQLTQDRISSANSSPINLLEAVNPKAANASVTAYLPVTVVLIVLKIGLSAYLRSYGVTTSK